jgi:hypothetical protein
VQTQGQEVHSTLKLIKLSLVECQCNIPRDWLVRLSLEVIRLVQTGSGTLALKIQGGDKWLIITIVTTIGTAKEGATLEAAKDDKGVLDTPALMNVTGILMTARDMATAARAQPMATGMGRVLTGTTMTPDEAQATDALRITMTALITGVGLNMAAARGMAVTTEEVITMAAGRTIVLGTMVVITITVITLRHPNVVTVRTTHHRRVAITKAQIDRLTTGETMNGIVPETSETTAIKVSADGGVERAMRLRHGSAMRRLKDADVTTRSNKDNIEVAVQRATAGLTSEFVKT